MAICRNCVARTTNAGRWPRRSRAADGGSTASTAAIAFNRSAGGASEPTELMRASAAVSPTSPPAWLLGNRSSAVDRAFLFTVESGYWDRTVTAYLLLTSDPGERMVSLVNVLMPVTEAARVEPLLRLRQATPDDVAAIADIWHLGWVEAHSGHVPAELVAHRTHAALLTAATDALDRTTVALLGDSPVGFVIAAQDEVVHLYVSARARCTGAATALLEHAVAAMPRCYDTAWLAVIAANALARGFYERAGWDDCGPCVVEVPVPDGDPVRISVHRYQRPRHLDPARSIPRRLGP